MDKNILGTDSNSKMRLYLSSILNKISNRNKNIENNNNDIARNNIYNIKGKNFYEILFDNKYFKSNLFFWGFFVSHFSNFFSTLKIFNLVKEKNLSLGNTIENIIFAREAKKNNFFNLWKFLSKSFFSINALIFNPKIFFTKSALYLSGFFSFAISDRKTYEDYLKLLICSFFLSVPFSISVEKFSLEKLNNSRLEKNNIHLRNYKKHVLFNCTVSTFLNNFLLNFIFFGSFDLLGKLGNQKGIEYTYDKRKIEEIFKIGNENETIARVLDLNPLFRKKSFVSDRILDLIFSCFITNIIFTPIESCYYIMRKYGYDYNSIKKNLNNSNFDGKNIHLIFLIKNFKMNMFKIFTINTVSSFIFLKINE
jgi:hypothetical protein